MAEIKNFAAYVEKVQNRLSELHGIRLDANVIDLVVKETTDLIIKEYLTAPEQPQQPPQPPPQPEQPRSKDITPNLSILSTPFADKPPYARNVWDMQTFDNKVYFGYGNASNYGPSGSVNGACGRCIGLPLPAG
ncbi:hypothetical protein [Fictibacillus fluitans]|uniref:Uncharacterized protein n=1 Tax=Fictibacillus fluitans TaxID=3058422 RepID=A0ABT8HX51_9BACL|nr:hypothetical protein [Fictibacillus sp. NE201]MDN4525308.1 hypothetical protein [Fictibacillus sp. NE201]